MNQVKKDVRQKFISELEAEKKANLKSMDEEHENYVEKVKELKSGQ